MKNGSCTDNTNIRADPMASPTKANPKTITFTDRAFTGVGSLIRLLPTGTVFLFQFLNPLLTNSGHCHLINKYLSGALIAISGISCFLSSFTDSYVDLEGSTHYGVATWKGLWPAPENEDVDMSAYKVRVGDFVHAFFSLVVFAVVALLDTNTVECFYPEFELSGKVLLMAAPPVIGTVSSSVFVLFPNKRHGIGYPSDDSD